MRLALLAGASPLRSSDGPISRLVKGRYLIHVEGLMNTVLGFNVDGLSHKLTEHDKELILSQASDVQVVFVSRGTEPFITVVAQRVA